MNVSKPRISSTLAYVLGLCLTTAIHAKPELDIERNSLHAQDNSVPSLQQLIENDALRIRSWIKPAKDSVVGQQLELNIEVATNSWFSGGTRIGRFELDDAIVLRRNKFAVNSSRREGGSTWSVQIWTVTIYPQRTGRFTVPPIELEISIANPNDPSAEIGGTFRTKSLTFTAALPESISNTGINHWIASPAFTVTDEFDKPDAINSDNATLSEGDALRRTITLRAENIAAMMLPVIDAASIPGLATYRRPAKLEDRVNRGTYIAVRREVITYVAEKEGAYTLPEITLYWWNTQTSALEQIQLPAHRLRVGTAEIEGTPLEPWPVWRWGVYTMAALLVLAPLIYLGIKSTRVHSLLKKTQRLFFPPMQGHKRRLIREYPGENVSKHILKTLHWLDSQGLDSKQSVRAFIAEQENSSLSAYFEQMMQSAFHDGGEPLTTAEYGFFMAELDSALNHRKTELSNREQFLNPRHKQA